MSGDPYIGEKKTASMSGFSFLARNHPNNQYPNNVNTTTANTGRNTR
jgi:hypothetical protein